MLAKFIICVERTLLFNGIIQSRLCITDAKNNLPATKYKQSKILHVLAHRFFELYQILAEQKETKVMHLSCLC